MAEDPNARTMTVGRPDPSTGRPRPHLVRAMRLRDVLLFYVITCFSVQWIGNAAIAGPSAVVIWAIACVAFEIPLVFTVLELSTRYPEEGGIYQWSKHAFGGLAGFMTAWTYWCANLPYFATLLYFTAATALHAAGPHHAVWRESRAYFTTASLIGLALAAWPNMVGLNVSKWLHNVGAFGMSVPALALIALAAISWHRFGPVTAFTAASLRPSAHLRDIVFWSTVAFSVSGLESASMLGDEIENPRRTVPRALLGGATIVILIYIVSTVAVLVVLPAERVTATSGFMDALTTLAGRLHVGWIALVAVVLVTAGGIGQCGAWFAAAARLPFVAGIDRYLPPVFARLHPRWQTPYVALLVQAAMATALVVASQLGTSVEGAYGVLVSVSVIVYFLPYLLMFAALIRLQRLPAGPGVMRVPGGRPVATVLGAVGFLTTAASVVLSLIPAPLDANPGLAGAKIVASTSILVGVGAAVYAVRTHRWRGRGS